MHNELYEIIADKVSNLILQNEDAIEQDFLENRKLADDPATVMMPITIKIEISRMGTTTSHKEKIGWEVKTKRILETPEGVYDSAQPDMFE